MKVKDFIELMEKHALQDFEILIIDRGIEEQLIIESVDIVSKSVHVTVDLSSII